jgi:cytochrome c oxidase assembly protein subunit 15
MAFTDWPTSDGQNLLLYPWLNDLRHTDRFTEHGHRLAGMVIGLTSIALVAVVFLRERRTWVRWFSIAILLAVTGQGLLGGARVLMDASLLAMVHSLTGALFFAMCVAFAMLTSTRWAATRKSISDQDRSQLSLPASVIVMALPFLVLVQYWLGGMFRHMGRMMFEHLAGAGIVALAGMTCVILLLRSESRVLRRSGTGILLALLLQLGLGTGAWLTKLNVPWFGWVASTGSLSSVVFRSMHTIGGMLLLTASVLAAVHVARQLSWHSVPSSLTLEGSVSKEGLA